MQRFANLEGRLDAVKRERSAARWRAVVVLLGLVLIGVGVAYFFVMQSRERAKSDVVRLPPVLEKPASPSRGDLALFGRALKELVTDCERHPAGSKERIARELGRRADRLANLHKVGRDLEPKLTREEARVLMALQNAERLMRQYLSCARGEQPGAVCDTGMLRTARAQIDKGLALARGERIEDSDLILSVKGLKPAVRIDPAADLMNQLDKMRRLPQKTRVLGGE